MGSNGSQGVGEEWDVVKAVRSYVDAKSEELVARLAESVAIESVSGDLTRRSSCIKQADWIVDLIAKVGGSSQKVELGYQETEDGDRYALPPVVFGEFGDGDVRKATVLCYCHYDVQPAEMEDGWESNPWVLTERKGRMYGRGSTDDKGPLLGWLWAVDAYKENGKVLPVNLKVCFEGMEECSSECLDELLKREAIDGGFLDDVDYVVVTDNYWITLHKPCLTYGLRGIASFEVEVRAGSKTLHSGVFGGIVMEPMGDLVQLLADLVRDPPQCIKKESAKELSEEEAMRYKGIEVDLEQMKEEAGGVKYLKGGKNVAQVLMNRWRYPSTTIHGIEGAYSGSGVKTIIPGSVVGKVSVRLVPDQDPDEVTEGVSQYLRKKFRELNSSNSLNIISNGAKAWLADPSGLLYEAGAASIRRVHGCTPDYTREGGSIPVVEILSSTLQAETMLLPLGASDDGAHGENEKFDRKCYLDGVVCIATLLEEIAARADQKAPEILEQTPRRGTLQKVKDLWKALA